MEAAVDEPDLEESDSITVVTDVVVDEATDEQVTVVDEEVEVAVDEEGLE
ncbi:hypothetical protein [Rubritalea sp.]